MSFFIKRSVFLLLFILHLSKCHEVIDLCSSDWRIYNANKSISLFGPVPGGIYSALEDTVRIGDILFGNNDIDYRWVGSHNWSYFRKFNVTDADLKFRSVQIVFHGLDTLAEVYINNQHVLSSDNMFVRYNIDVKNILTTGQNNITVEFQSPINAANKIASKIGYTVPPACHPPSYNGECNINMLRKMQASFSWDWGPAFPSVGIWKPVEIVLSEGPVIRSIGVCTIPEDSYWRLNVTVWFDPSNLKLQDNLFVELSHPTSGLIFVSGKKMILNKYKEKQSVKISVLVAKSKIEPWWPNGYGKQNLYNLRVYYTQSEKRVQIGFRTIDLIQENVSPDENNGKTFYFRVNGVNIFAKGSNWIPSHVLPESLSDGTRIIPLLEAGAAAHFNMIRVWGGGVYESDLFYETCDRLGILVWQDLMFACSMYPVTNEFLMSVKGEVEQQVQRLQHHPSIAIWAGNNENEGALVGNWYGTSSNFSLYKSDYLKLYVETIKPILEENDVCRKYLTSSPSNGVETEKEGFVSKNPGDSLYGDVHYYNYINNGWDYRIYPKPRFASEYGSQSLPTYNCLRSALPLGRMNWGSTDIEHRQHAPAGNSIIMQQITINLPKANRIDDIIYLSQINQAMSMKTESEKYRRLKSFLLDSGEGYTMGALYWQLDDIWQAPSWSSIDYCGHWKMLHYFVQEFFSPIITSIELTPDGSTVALYVVIDGPAQYSQANISLNVYKFLSSDWQPVKEIDVEKQLEENKSFMVLQAPLNEVLSGCGNKAECFLTSSIEVNNEPIAPENFLFLSSLNNQNYPQATVKITATKLINKNTATLTLSADKYALFVWLDLNGLDGVFSKNGFHMLKPTIDVVFTSKYSLDQTMLNKILVRCLQQNYL